MKNLNKIIGMVFAVIFISGALATVSIAEEAKEKTLIGRIMFSDYYSMDGQKCAAFMETPDGDILCVLENENSAKIKTALGGVGGEVKVTGTVIKEPKGTYLKIYSYRYDTGLENQIEKAREMRRQVKK